VAENHLYNDQRIILVDWGTTCLRAFLLEDRAIAARITGPGIGMLAEPPAAALRTALASWLEASPGIEVVMCGMAGSRNGIREVPYVAAPAGAADWRDGARSLCLWGSTVTIAAGLQGRNTSGAPDLMRGEETQIFGAISRQPQLATGRHLLVLPGTHSKWTEIRDGAICRFHTALTGELRALLLQHSLLLRAGAAEGEAGDGFEAGLARAVETRAGLLGSLFEVRSAQIVSGRSRRWSEAFLSGLLIGEESMRMSAAFDAAGEVVLIGAAELCALYALALSRHGLAARTLDGDDCALAGLALLAGSERQVTQYVH
jgi:2-dehydro-3-deoxygalactonokinase